MSDGEDRDDGLIQGKLTDASIELMRRRIGYPNPTLRGGIHGDEPWNRTATTDSIRHWAIGNGDDNPLYSDPEYGNSTRWGGMIAPPGYESTMGFDRSRKMDPAFERETRPALRGVHLFNSGMEAYFHAPIRPGAVLYRSKWVSDIETKVSRFGGRSAIVSNGSASWDQSDEVVSTGSSFFVHVERERRDTKEARVEKEGEGLDGDLATYTDESLREIEDAYDNEFVRGSDTLYYEELEVGQELPLTVKGPFTITDLINFHMGWGWGNYGNPPHRLAFENRKVLRGFYSRNEFRAWDTIQRLHWDEALARQVGVKHTYDIGPVRYGMVCHYCTNFAGDDGWVYRIRCEYRSFNFVGDTTWIRGEIVELRVDEDLGPLVEVKITGTNQRGQENIRASATILCTSREHGEVRMPPTPAMTPNRS
jgi:acyl dehydratase